MKFGANVDVLEINGTTPLFYAVCNNLVSIVELLACYERIKISNSKKEQLFEVAVRNGCCRNIKLLIEVGASISFKDIRNYNALQYAVRYNMKDVVELFIQMNVNLNAIDYDGNTLLDIAISYNYYDIVELLVRTGINTTYITKRSRNSPLRARTTGAKTWNLVVAGSSRIWSTIACGDWRVTAFPHLGQCGRPARAKSRRR